MSRDFMTPHRINFLQKVMINKEKLFGKFSSTTTQQEKDAIWKSILESCVQDGAVQWAKKNVADIKKNVWGYIEK